MKRLILDHLRRRGLVLLLFLVGAFVIEYCASGLRLFGGPVLEVFDKVERMLYLAMSFQLVLWLSLFQGFELLNGFSRVSLSLPLTARQIGQAFWWETVGIPALGLSVAGLLAASYGAVQTHSAILWQPALGRAGLMGLTLAACFGVQTFVWAISTSGFLKRAPRLKAMLFGLGHILSIGGWLAIQQAALPVWLMLVVMGVFVVFAVAGWYRAELLIRHQVTVKLGTWAVPAKAAAHRVPTGIGGLGYLIRVNLVRSVMMGFVFLGVMLVITPWLERGRSPVPLMVSMLDQNAFLLFFCMMPLLPLAFEVRQLRTLPISVPALAATMVFLPVTALAIIFLTAGLVLDWQIGVTASIAATRGFLTSSVMCAWGVTIVIWRGMDTGAWLLIMLMMFAKPFLSLGATLVFHLTRPLEMPLWLSAVASGLLIMAAYLAMNWLLRRSSSAYRVRKMMMGQWGGAT